MSGFCSGCGGECGECFCGDNSMHAIYGKVNSMVTDKLRMYGKNDDWGNFNSSTMRYIYKLLRAQNFCRTKLKARKHSKSHIRKWLEVVSKLSEASRIVNVFLVDPKTEDDRNLAYFKEIMEDLESATKDALQIATRDVL